MRYRSTSVNKIWLPSSDPDYELFDMKSPKLVQLYWENTRSLSRSHSREDLPILASEKSKRVLQALLQAYSYNLLVELHNSIRGFEKSLPPTSTYVDKKVVNITFAGESN